MTLLITGATGFVGSALLEKITNSTEEVIALTRRIPRDRPGSKSVRWLKRDLTSRENPLEGVKNVDVVIHLAGRAHILQEHSADPLGTYRRVNLEATERLAWAAVTAGARRLVFASSIGVHGTALSKEEIITEDSPIGPIKPYDISKWEAELALREIALKTGLELVVIRSALVAGQAPPGNMARLASLVNRGIPLPVPSQDNVRSFTGLKNLIDLILICIERPAAVGETFLVAEPHWPSTRQVIHWIGEGMGKPVRTVPLPASLMRTCAWTLGKADLYDKVFGDLRIDASKARSRLGWEPSQNLSDAIRDVGRKFNCLETIKGKPMSLGRIRKLRQT